MPVEPCARSRAAIRKVDKYLPALAGEFNVFCPPAPDPGEFDDSDEYLGAVYARMAEVVEACNEKGVPDVR